MTYVSLDSFRKTRENKPKDGLSELEAWLTFFTVDTPEDVLSLVREWPMFLSMYQDIANFRKQPEEVIGMFSEALRIMDRNTTKYMIDSMQQNIEELKQEIADNEKTIADNEKTIADNEKTIAEKDRIIAKLMLMTGSNEDIS